GGRRCRSHTRCAAGPAPWRMGSRSAPTSFRRRRRGARPGATRRRAWQSSPDQGGERELPAKKRARGAVVNGDAREAKPAAPAVAGDVHPVARREAEAEAGCAHRRAERGVLLDREAAWTRKSMDRPPDLALEVLARGDEIIARLVGRQVGE